MSSDLLAGHQHPAVDYLAVVRLVLCHRQRDHEHLVVLAYEEPEGPHPHDALPRVVLEHEYMVIPDGLHDITGLHLPRTAQRVGSALVVVLTRLAAPRTEARGAGRHTRIPPLHTRDSVF